MFLEFWKLEPSPLQATNKTIKMPAMLSGPIFDDEKHEKKKTKFERDIFEMTVLKACWLVIF